jgi:hypothetical protein
VGGLFRHAARLAHYTSHRNHHNRKRSSDAACNLLAAPADATAPRLPSPPQEGFFGFRPFSELWTGRLAMMGFASGVTNELVTGQPILQQLGATTPDGKLFGILATLIGGATLFATARTLFRLTSGEMTLIELRRYSNFFGLSAEAVAEAEAKERKRAGDFTSATDLNAIDAARAAGTAADAALMVADAAVLSADAAAAPAMAAAAPAAPAVSRAQMAADQEAAYAREVELTNGRWAMLGFASAILIEAATGAGVVGQLEGYAKAAGLLGAQSGF